MSKKQVERVTQIPDDFWRFVDGTIAPTYEQNVSVTQMMTDLRLPYGPDNWVDCIRAEYGDDAPEFGFGRSVWAVWDDSGDTPKWQRLEA